MKNRAAFSSETIHWATPKAFYSQLDAEFQFDLDPCPLGGNVEGADPRLWSGKRVFCNPPYGPDIRKFLECWPHADLAVYLIPARTDTRWFHEIVLLHASEIRFIKSRLKFGDGKGRAPYPSMVVVFGGEKQRISLCSSTLKSEERVA